MDEPEAPLERIKRDLGGLLSVAVYEHIYDAARAAGGGTFVEIGSARGAATAALALGARAAGAPFHIYTVDGFDGRLAPRWQGRTLAENVAWLRAGLGRLGILDDVTVAAGGSADLVAAHEPHDIRLLLIDADGRIDRDLDVLLDRLAPGAAVIIDDIDDNAYAERRGGKVRIDLKHRIAHLLVDALLKRDVLRLQRVVDNCGFYVRGQGQLDRGEWQRAVIAAYRTLVFTDLDPRMLGTRARARVLAENHAPRLLAFCRKLRGLG